MKDYNEIIKANFGQLKDDELTKVLSYFHEEELFKNEIFTKTGSYCDRLSIIKSGLLRVYTVIDAKEITQWISTKNYFITEISSFFFNQPNRWTIQALTDIVLLTISKTNYEKLCQEFPRWNEIEKEFIAKCFVILEDRVFSHLSMTAEERYDLYFQYNKELFNQVPLRYIASVLGMTPETFSRIRKRQAESS